MDPNTTLPSTPADYNPFYEQYKDGIMTGIVPAITVMLIILLFGYFGNFNIVYATIRNKNLQGSCNWLIVFASIADSVHVTGHTYFGYTIYSSTNFINVIDCLHVMTVPLVGLCTGNIFILLIGVDRLLSIIFPVKQLDRKLIILIYLVISIPFPVYILYISYVQANLWPNTKVVCLIVEAMHGTPNDIYSTISLSIMIATIICYIMVWILLKTKSNKSKSFNSMFKSLTIIMLTVFFSWLLVASLMRIASAMNASMDVGFYVPLYSGITVNLSCAANFYILYYSSVEYRAAFQQQLTKFFGIHFKKNAVVMLSSQQTQSQMTNSQRS